MNLKSRTSSIMNASHLATSLTGIPTFYLSELQIAQLPEFDLPANRRLGHLVEKVVSELINASDNYELLYENVQIIQDKQTIGELDFIIQHVETRQITHIELAYKFYLFDPTLSDDVSKNWIGPNRRDALHEKLEKLQQKQFPLLYHEATEAVLPKEVIENAAQKLCVLAYLYLPYAQKIPLKLEYQAAIVGHYMDFETFQRLDNPAKAYYIPPKKAWGIDPATHTNWEKFNELATSIQNNLANKRSLLCWQKLHDTYETFFIVWW